MEKQNSSFLLPATTCLVSALILSGCAFFTSQPLEVSTHAQAERTEMVVMRTAQEPTVAIIEAEEGTFFWRPQVAVTQPSKLIKR
jgi:hypothetical protein